MPGTGNQRSVRLAELERRILETAPDPIGAPEELAEIAMRTHHDLALGRFGKQPTELRLRLHGKGVTGHMVPSDQAGALLKQMQLVVRWIGFRVRALANEPEASTKKKKERESVADATRLFLRPQFGAGSLIFELVAADKPKEPEVEQPALMEGEPSQETLLDRSIQELLEIVNSSEADTADDLGGLSAHVALMGPRVASQLKKLAEQVTADQIDIDLRWRGADGRRHKSSLSRRGALAIKDAVERNKVRTKEVPIVGLLETVSTGKDPVRIDTDDKQTYKLSVEEELGITLGAFLHKRVSATALRTTKWHDSGKETHSYELLAVELIDELPEPPEAEQGPESL